MAAPATIIVLIAGGSTFVAEWAFKKEIDWKVPLATVLLAAGAEGVSAIDRNGAIILALMVFLGAVTTKFDGHSTIDLITSAVNSTNLAGSTGSSTSPAK